MENRQGMQVHGKCAKLLLAAALVFACDRTKLLDSGEVHVMLLLFWLCVVVCIDEDECADNIIPAYPPDTCLLHQVFISRPLLHPAS